MGFKLGIAKKLLLLVAPVLTTLAASPSQAATFALSKGTLEFTFSQNPENAATSTNTNTVAIANSGKVNVGADATANLIANPPEAFNLSSSVTFGDGRDYLGLAQSQAELIGDFLVEAGNSFSFDFAANFKLETSIDNPFTEDASAIGNLSFLLLDTTNQANQIVLDFFNLFGSLDTPGTNDSLEIATSESVTLSNNLPPTTIFGGNQELISTQINGSLLRSFNATSPTRLTLIEVKRNQARVIVPEPTSTLALLFSCGLIGIGLTKRTRSTTNKA